MDQRITLVLVNDMIRARAARLIAAAPQGSRLEFKGPKRTLPQNSRFWAMLGDIAAQMTWYGLTLSSEDWRLVFLDALKRETRIVPNLDGTGFVQLGRSSSDLSIAEMGDLMLIIESFGALHGVTFHAREAA